MLDATITLPVVGGDVGINRYSEEKDKSTYLFNGATWAKRKEVSFLRSIPKASGAYPGNARGTVKVTWDTEVVDKLGNTIVAPVIATIQYSIPVGAADAVITDHIKHVAAVLNHASLPAAIFKSLQI